MMTKIKRKGVIGLMGLMGFIGLVGCSDWTDHYDADTKLVDSQRATLWENINSDANLSQFAALLKKAGYDQVLSETQTYTVWAPANGSFDYDALNAWSNSRLQREFIENHIARNNYPASGKVEERVYTLNEKSMIFSGSGQYDIQGVSVSSPNLACSNGMIHKLNGKIDFRANIYESLNNNDFPLDSIANFIHSYDVKKLNEQRSVKGPTVNGEITYLDSIFDEHNDMFTRLRAYINREDSNYTMLVPTNEAWNKARRQLSSYFNYVPQFEFMENTSTEASEKKLTTVTLSDLTYLKDSIEHLALVCDLCYNNNIYDNKKLNQLQTGETLMADSLYGTLETKIYAEDSRRLFANARRVDKSNGAIWITDSMAMRTWTTWNPEIRVEAENQSTLSSTVNTAGTPERWYVAPGTQNPNVSGQLSGNSYIQVTPVSLSSNPGVVFYLPNVRSTTYSVYIVMVPGNIVSDNIENKPYRFNASMGYATATGKNEDRDRSWLVDNYFSNDSTKIDTVYLGDFTFPVAYVGTGPYYPYLRVNSAVTSRERTLYDRNLRIDCIILRPKELDDYLKEHPEYQYDRGIY